jgi:hypothetical protein
MYKIILSREVQILSKDNINGSTTFIPFDEANIEYQKYLEWVAEGNTAEEITEGME